MGEREGEVGDDCRWLVLARSVFKPGTRRRGQKAGGKVKLWDESGSGRDLGNSPEMFGDVGPQTLALAVGVCRLQRVLGIKHKEQSSTTLTCSLYLSPPPLRFAVHGQRDEGTREVGQMSSFAATVGGPGETRVWPCARKEQTPTERTAWQKAGRGRGAEQKQKASPPPPCHGGLRTIRWKKAQRLCSSVRSVLPFRGPPFASSGARGSYFRAPKFLRENPFWLGGYVRIKRSRTKEGMESERPFALTLLALLRTPS